MQGKKQLARRSQRRSRGPWDNPGDLPGYRRSMRRASNIKFYVSCYSFVYVCWWEKQQVSSSLAHRGAKEVMAAGLVREAHAHKQSRNCPAVVLLCCAVLCCACPLCYANDQSGRSALERTESKVPLAGVWPGPACCYAAS